ncbi:putative transglycosylase [Caulobacter phage Kuura]|nr:putative transglycosylase [Caulobacter phage Kuura]
MAEVKQGDWWKSTPWWNVQPKADDLTTWPLVAPVYGSLKAVDSLGPRVDIGGFMKNHTPILTPNPDDPLAPKAAAPSAPTAGSPWDFAAGGGTPLDVSGIIGAESGGNPNAANPRSTAAGLGQFIDSTWADPDLRKRAGFDKIDDKTWMAQKTNPTAATAMTQAYAQRNTEQWQKGMGTPPNPGQLYGMHFLDAQPFMLLTKTAATDPGHDAAAMFPKAAQANPEVFYKGTGKQRQPRTASELYAEITRRGTAAAGGGDPFTMPDLQGPMSPEAAVAMLPNVPKPTMLDLPDAPQMAEGPARPTKNALPVADWMAKLEALAPEAYDKKAAAKGRLGVVLAGIAQGAANVDARQGAGAVLAAIGAGASRAAAGFDEAMKGDEKAAKEAQRLFSLSLARQGIDWDGDNIGRTEANAESAWMDQRDKVTRQFTNANAQYEVQTKEALTNLGLLNSYAADIYQAGVLRARTALQAVEAGAAFANEQALGQQSLDLKRFIFEDEKASQGINVKQAKVIGNMAASIGVDPKTALATKNQPQINALQGAAYIAANNKPAAIAALGRELVLTNNFALITDQKTRAEIEMLAKQDPELAAAAVGRLLNGEETATPGSTLGLAGVMAGLGTPLASLFVKNTRPTKPTANATPVAAKK